MCTRLSAKRPHTDIYRGKGVSGGKGKDFKNLSPFPLKSRLLTKHMIDILNLTLPELTEFMVVDLGEPKFRAKQVWQWLWSRGARTFDEMSDVSKATRAALAEAA